MRILQDLLNLPCDLKGSLVKLAPYLVGEAFKALLIPHGSPLLLHDRIHSSLHNVRDQILDRSYGGVIHGKLGLVGQMRLQVGNRLLEA